MSELRYRGRSISQEDILYIRALVERYPRESRRKLSVRLCEAWQWRQANGALRDMVCRGLLLMLERAGQITLPPVSYVRHNPLSRRARPQPVLIDATPIEGPLCNLQPVELEQVRRTTQEPLFNSLIEEHHHLGYEQPVGEHLKYVVWANGRPMACLAWSSAPRHLASRDHYIGWDAAARRAHRVEIKHQTLTHGDRCPECGQGNVYGQKEPKVLVRVTGQAPLTATVYSLERLRCGACGQVFTAQEPEGVGEDKYDESAAAMIAQLKYGSGTPFHRLEQLEKQLGIPLPAATQWGIVEQAAHLIKPARDELIRRAAQSEVVHNDDTSMRVLRLERDPKDERTGVFTSGIVSAAPGRKIALYFTGSQHAGENLADVLKQRSRELPSPVQMCDALSRNVPRLAAGTEILLANCLAHGRRQFVDVAENFPRECRYVLEMLGLVYGYDAEARELGRMSGCGFTRNAAHR
jgi:transposase